MTPMYILIPTFELTQRHLNLSIHTSFSTCPVVEDAYTLVEVLAPNARDIFDNPKWDVFLDYRIFTKEELQLYYAGVSNKKRTVWESVTSWLC